MSTAFARFALIGALVVGVIAGCGSEPTANSGPTPTNPNPTPDPLPAKPAAEDSRVSIESNNDNVAISATILTMEQAIQTPGLRLGPSADSPLLSEATKSPPGCVALLVSHPVEVGQGIISVTDSSGPLLLEANVAPAELASQLPKEGYPALCYDLREIAALEARKNSTGELVGIAAGKAGTVGYLWFLRDDAQTATLSLPGKKPIRLRLSIVRPSAPTANEAPNQFDEDGKASPPVTRPLTESTPAVVAGSSTDPNAGLRKPLIGVWQLYDKDGPQDHFLVVSEKSFRFQSPAEEGVVGAYSAEGFEMSVEQVADRRYLYLELAYDLLPAASPQPIDFYPWGQPRRRNDTCHGILSLSGNQLSIANGGVGSPRPSKFEPFATYNPAHNTSVYQRVTLPSSNQVGPAFSGPASKKPHIAESNPVVESSAPLAPVVPVPAPAAAAVPQNLIPARLLGLVLRAAPGEGPIDLSFLIRLETPVGTAKEEFFLLAAGSKETDAVRVRDYIKTKDGEEFALPSAKAMRPLEACALLRILLKSLPGPARESRWFVPYRGEPVLMSGVRDQNAATIASLGRGPASKSLSELAKSDKNFVEFTGAETAYPRLVQGTLTPKTSPVAGTPTPLRSLSIGKYRLKWKVSRVFVLEAIFSDIPQPILTDVSRDDEVEVFEKDGSLQLKLVGDKHFGGRSSKLLIADGRVEFRGDYCGDPDLVFRGVTKEGVTLGETSGKLSNQAGQEKSNEPWTFELTPLP